MTLRPDVEALIQGALDDTLTPEERERLDRLMIESVEARGRAAHLKELANLLDSLGPAEPPATLVHDVLAQISRPAGQQTAGASGHAEARHATPSPGTNVGTRAGWGLSTNPFVRRRGIALDRKFMLGLAAAAVLVLGVLSFVSYPPATGGTEATIGVAPRAQSPRRDAKDIDSGDTSAQVVLQTDTWDQIVKDDDLRTLLQDANFRARLQAALARPAFQNALRDKGFARVLSDSRFGPAMANGITECGGWACGPISPVIDGARAH